MRRHASAVLAITLLLAALSMTAGAQESSEGAYELGLWKWLNSRDLLYVPIAITRKDEIEHAEGLIGASYVWDFERTVSTRVGYRYSWELTEPAPGTEPYREQRVVAEVNERPRWGSRAEFMNRTRFELRWIDGAPSWRLRERVLAGRKLAPKHNIALTAYGTFEATYDSRYNTINRLRLSVGAATRFNSHVMLDTYFARQLDSRSDASQVQSFGMTLNLTY